MKKDVAIVGAGPGGVFAAIELKRKRPDLSVVVYEQGMSIGKRRCPIEKNGGECLKCKPFCHITSGFSGAGAFSDGKLSLFHEDDTDILVGGDLHHYIGVENTKDLMRYVDSIYLEFGADNRLEGIDYLDEIIDLKKKAKENNIELVSIPIRHLGTEKSHLIYQKIEQYLISLGIELKFSHAVNDLIVENGTIKGIKVVDSASYIKGDFSNAKEVYSDNVIIAVGRKGAKWMFDMCQKHNIKNQSGVVDIGVRFELPDEVMKDINKYMYEGKFVGYPEPFKDKVRTFCQNPSGFVSVEVYDNNITIANGHSYKEKKSNNTNLAILVSHEFQYPFKEPIKFGRNIAMNTNDLGAGNILIQRFGDILKGKRTWDHELKTNSVVPTLSCAAAGDITSALPYRTMTDIINFILTMDKIVKGFANPDNLLYAPEIKFYSNKVTVNNNLETSIKGLLCIGDTGGLTRGLMLASCSGVQAARNIISGQR